MSIRVYVESLGCKLNQCERDLLARQFFEAGYAVVSRPEDADLCIVNTCAVTRVAARKSRHRFRYLQRINPSARLVATGCYAGLRLDGLEVDLVVTNERKEDLVSVVAARWGPAELGGSRAERSAGMASRTRPMVKIQDGCDNTCTYCIVRVLRGPQRSRPRSEILAEVRDLVHQGYHEVVLTGVHVGAYGRDSGDSLAGLVRAVLAQSLPDRLRLSSIEPWDLSPDFVDLWADPRLCRHLHLPLQSGCDATLERMNRRYTSAQFAELVARARAAIPDLAVTTDVIAGFPGETDQEFAASAAFVEQMQFARIHVFPYSERPGTPAAAMPDQVDFQVRRQRARLAREIGQRSGRAFRQRFLGRTLAVLWERRLDNGRWSGLADNYIRVYAQAERDLANVLCDARLSRLDSNGVYGEIVS
jgi:threonylcarbamoyladenosine tRNA methylthiotransferase MtaB